jgi:signal transduction histidine kinase
MREDPTPGGLPAAARDPLAARDLASLYADALAGIRAESGEGTLRRAYEIGRQGIARGVGLLEMATLHHEALARVLAPMAGSPRIQQQALRRAGEFLAESLSPYEMAHRGFSEAVCALRRLNETMEGEIQRIAHAVHDEAGQLLDAARLAMCGVEADASPVLRQGLREIAAILDQAEAELRRLSHELRPMILDDLGLVPALQVVAEGMARRSGLTVQVETCLERRPPANVETALYRIVQEALTNVIRHARATNVKIHLIRDSKGTLRCAIRDDGVGFDVVTLLARKERGGLGLIGMRERLNAVGGTLHIHSEIRWGTELRIEIPADK